MADKVLRFTAEDSGYGQTIDRMTAKLRSAFSNAGMTDILQDADSRFTKFSDKVRYIQTQLAEIRNNNEQERQEEVQGAVHENIRTGYKRSNDAVQKEVSRTYEKEERAIERLIEAFEKFGQKLEDIEDREQENRGSGGGGRVIPVERGPRKDDQPNTHRASSAFGNIFQIATGVGLERLGESIISTITGYVKAGTELARNELQINRAFTYDSDKLGTNRANELVGLGISNKDYIKSVGEIAASRKSGTNIDNEVFRRLELSGAYGVTGDQFKSLDRFYRPQNSSSGMLDKSGLDAASTISEILSRADRQGILGVSKNDFTMLPEKIGQVTGLMQQQYAQSERTDANAAINLMLSGQKIGGRFADDRAADTFGKLNEGITNPRSAGGKAFILEALRRANPGLSPLQLEAQMQNGLSEDNIKAIFPAIQHVRSHEMRGRIFQQAFGLDAQSSLRMAEAGSIPAIMQQMHQKGGDRTDQEKQIRERAVAHTLVLDQFGKLFSNSVTAFGESINKMIQRLGTPDAPNLDLPKRLLVNKVIASGSWGARVGIPETNP